MSYSSIVERDSVHIEFMIIVMNDLDVLATDLVKIDLNAKSRERTHV